MMRPCTVTAAIALLLSANAACRRETPRAPAPPPASASTAAAPAPQDTGFAGTTAPLRRARTPRSGVPPAMLQAAPVTSGPGYDRVVFEFLGDSVPGYTVQYESRPVRRCGSGDPVSLAGTAGLVVTFQPARAHDDHGAPAQVERHRAPGLPAIKQITLLCDFEGQVEWVLGVSGAAPYRVSEHTGPARLVLDVRHGK